MQAVRPGQRPAFSETHRGLKSIMLVSNNNNNVTLKITTVEAKRLLIWALWNYSGNCECSLERVLSRHSSACSHADRSQDSYDAPSAGAGGRRQAQQCCCRGFRTASARWSGATVSTKAGNGSLARSGEQRARVRFATFVIGRRGDPPLLRGR